MSITPEVLEQLKAPFPDDKIGVRIQHVNKDGNRALLIKYLSHIDVADRLDEIDPAWSTQIVTNGYGQVEDQRMVFTHMKLTILGVSRDNVGEGRDPKSSASDALKRCAMCFGIGRDLYEDVPVWVDYSEADRFREWTVEDYEAGLAQAGRPIDPPRAPSGRKPPVAPKRGPAARAAKPAVLPITKPALHQEIRRCARLADFSEVELQRWACESAGVSADKMDVPQLQQFIGELHFEMRKAGIQV